MTETPLISVIVPVYNCEKYLQECIDSILAQTYSNLELIIVNDGSTDGSTTIINMYATADKRVRVLSQANQGPSSARNLALGNMRGRYVTFVDADDYISSEFLEVLYILLQESGSDMAAAAYSRSRHPEFNGHERYFTIEASGYLADVLYKRCSDNSIWGKLYDASLWKGVRFVDMRYEDLEIFPRICLRASTVTVTEAKLYFYRCNESSFINTFTAQRLEALKAVDMIIETLSSCATKSHDKLVRAAQSRKLAASFNIFLITFGRSDCSRAAESAWSNILSLRGSCLSDPDVSLKIKAGILASYTGKGTLAALNGLFRISS